MFGLSFITFCFKNSLIVSVGLDLKTLSFNIFLNIFTSADLQKNFQTFYFLVYEAKQMLQFKLILTAASAFVLTLIPLLVSFLFLKIPFYFY